VLTVVLVDLGAWTVWKAGLSALVVLTCLEAWQDLEDWLLARRQREG
jgi:hypothetical protein